MTEQLISELAGPNLLQKMSDAQIVMRVIEIDNHLLAITDKPPRIKRGRDTKFLVKTAKRQSIIKEDC